VTCVKTSGNRSETVTRVSDQPAAQVHPLLRPGSAVNILPQDRRSEMDLVGRKPQNKRGGGTQCGSSRSGRSLTRKEIDFKLRKQALTVQNINIHFKLNNTPKKRRNYLSVFDIKLTRMALATDHTK